MIAAKVSLAPAVPEPTAEARGAPALAMRIAPRARPGPAGPPSAAARRRDRTGERLGRKAAGLGELLERERALPVGVRGSAQKGLGHLHGVGRHRAHPVTPAIGGDEQLL